MKSFSDIKKLLPGAFRRSVWQKEFPAEILAVPLAELMDVTLNMGMDHDTGDDDSALTRWSEMGITITRTHLAADLPREPVYELERLLERIGAAIDKAIDTRSPVVCLSTQDAANMHVYHQEMQEACEALTNGYRGNNVVSLSAARRPTAQFDPANDDIRYKSPQRETLYINNPEYLRGYVETIGYEQTARHIDRFQQEMQIIIKRAFEARRNQKAAFRLGHRPFYS